MGRNDSEDWLDGLDKQQNVYDDPGKSKYRRLNKKRLAFVIAMFTLIIACCVVIILVVSTLFSSGGIPASSQAAIGNTPGTTASPDPTAPDSPEPGTTSPSPGTTSPAAADVLKGKTIILDAGHGGIDPGAEGKGGTQEDELNLQVTKKLKTALESMGAVVTMTRSDGNAIAKTKEEDMAKRGKIIKDNQTDIAISIHMNSLKSDSSVSGPLTIFMTGSEKGKSLAEAIMTELNAKLQPATDGKARSQGDLLILKSGYQPTVIVECGYISNAEEEAKLKQGDYQDQIVQAICAGVQAYFESAGT